MSQNQGGGWGCCKETTEPEPTPAPSPDCQEPRKLCQQMCKQGLGMCPLCTLCCMVRSAKVSKAMAPYCSQATCERDEEEAHLLQLRSSSQHDDGGGGSRPRRPERKAASPPTPIAEGSAARGLATRATSTLSAAGSA